MYPIMGCVFPWLLTLMSRTLEMVVSLSWSMTDSSIWLLVIWPKWILETNGTYFK